MLLWALCLEFWVATEKYFYCYKFQLKTYKEFVSVFLQEETVRCREYFATAMMDPPQ